VVRYNDTIDKALTIALFDQIPVTYACAAHIYVTCDNARYWSLDRSGQVDPGQPPGLRNVGAGMRRKAVLSQLAIRKTPPWAHLAVHRKKTPRYVR
jgi:hypothetical protein